MRIFNVMTRGTLCAIVCPLLEDELVHGLETDPEPKNIYIVEGDYVRTIRRKMDARSIPYAMMDEYSLRTSLDLDKDAFNVVIVMNPLKLHKEPAKLRNFIQDQLIRLQGRFDAIAMYYGMCGNFGWDITKWAADNIDTPVTVFHDCNGDVCDDCISVAVGGHNNYCDLVKEYTGMFFMTPSTATLWDEYPDPDTHEWEGFYESRDDYMRDMMSWGGYKYALRIDTGLGEREIFEPMAQDMSARLGLELIDPKSPVATRELADDIYSRSKALLKG